MAGSHDKLIADAAKQALAPLGFHRRGRSRVWLADHGWWLAVVEFQPSGWARGSYVNVAAHWLWNAKGYVTHDLGACPNGSRSEAFVKYTSDEQFEPEANRLAYSAAHEAGQLRSKCRSIDAVAAMLREKEEGLPEAARGSWGAFNAGVALGLSGQLPSAKAMMAAISDQRVLPDAEALQQSLGSEAEFRRKIDNLISKQRRGLGIDPKV